MSRETFLARVRQAAHAGRLYRVHAGDEATTDVGYIGAGDDPVARMASEVAAVGGFAHVVEDLATARDTLAAIIRDRQARSALCWQHALLERLQLGELLASLGVERLTHDGLAALPQPQQRAAMLAADIGITSATYAIAETGTLAMASAPGSERLASLLPPVHVAVIEAAQVLPDLFDLFARLQGAGVEHMASNLTLITGPSKTGDIELKLTTGVHGPGAWHVIIIHGPRS
jgi:L-lactate utilization protein LutC